jgi:phosphatidylserine/phosphatidylglycerophosphate/cardiolipin synthase-like enzyme
VNWSKTSFMDNREAGVIISGKGAAAAINFMQQVYDDDWAQGLDYKLTRDYTSEEEDEIREAWYYYVNIPTPPDIPGAFVTAPPTAFTTNGKGTVFTSPDGADKFLLTQLQDATKSLQLFIYQVTDTTLCNQLETMYKSGLNVTMLVSSDIFSSTDKAAATQCYNQLSSAGLAIQVTPVYYKFSHQKTWIIDGTVGCVETGNWSPSDFAPVLDSSGVYPPYSNSDWQDCNRDFGVCIEDPTFVNNIATVMNNDYVRGAPYSPSTSDGSAF